MKLFAFFAFASQAIAQDVDECALGTDNCDDNATCTNTDGGFTCVCNSGFEGPGDTCFDVDECTDGTSNCDPNATCTNTNGGFTCACNENFSGDGVTCVEVGCFGNRQEILDDAGEGTGNCVPADMELICTSTGFELDFYHSDIYENVDAVSEAIMDQMSVWVGEDPALCSGTFVKDVVDGIHKVSLDFDWSECGNVSPVYSPDADAIVYLADVTATPAMFTLQDNNGVDIDILQTRTQQFQIQCSYDASFELDFDTQIGAADAIELGVGDAALSWASNFDLVALLDQNDPTSVVAADNKVMLGDDLFNTISQVDLPDEISWSVEYCKVATDDTKTSFVTLFDNYECSNDLFNVDFEGRTADQTYQTGDETFPFTFQAFTFGQELAVDASLYLYCKIQMCTVQMMLDGTPCAPRDENCDAFTGFAMNLTQDEQDAQDAQDPVDPVDPVA